MDNNGNYKNNVNEASLENDPKKKLSIIEICAMATLVLVIIPFFCNLYYSVSASTYYNIPLEYFFDTYLRSAMRSVPYIFIILSVAWFTYFIKKGQPNNKIEKGIDYMTAFFVSIPVSLLILSTLSPILKSLIGNTKFLEKIDSENKAYIFIAFVFALSFLAMLGLINLIRKVKVAKNDIKLPTKKPRLLLRLMSNFLSIIDKIFFAIKMLSLSIISISFVLSFFLRWFSKSRV